MKENYSRGSEFSPWENEMFSGAIGALANERYQPAIPLFMSWFESSHGPTMSGPWTSLSKFGIEGTRALIPALDSKDADHRAQAIEMLLMNAKLNPQNKHPDHLVSEQEYEPMRELFTRQVLPKLKVMAKDEVSVELRNQARFQGDEIESQINRRPTAPPPVPLPPAKFHGPFVTLSVDPDRNLNRTILDPEPENLGWVIVRDGTIVLQRNAKNETQFKCGDEQPGVYAAYLTTPIAGAYRVISNVVFYTVQKPTAPTSTPRSRRR